MPKHKATILLVTLYLTACSESNTSIPVNERAIVSTRQNINILCKNDLDIDTRTPFPKIIRNINKGVFELEFFPVSNRETYYKAVINTELEKIIFFIVAKINTDEEHHKTLAATSLSMSLEWSLSNISAEQAHKYQQNSISGFYPVQGKSIIVQNPQIQSRSNTRQVLTHQLIQSETNAIDISAPMGSNVVSFKGGTVIWTESRYGDYGCKKTDYLTTGNSIFILHDDGTEARYLHLKHNSIKVKVGQIIHEGQLLAQVGNSGPSNEPHLHFQVGGFVNKELTSFPILFKSFPTETPWTPYYLQNVDSDYPEQ